MTLRLIPLTLIAMIIVSFQTRSEATTPPEAKPLLVQSAREHIVSPGLEEWLDRYAAKPNLLELEDADFQAAVEKRKGYTRAYLEMARANRSQDEEAVKETFARVRTFLKGEELSKKPKSSQHPILPFLYLELARASGISEQDQAYAMAGMVEYGKGTCAQKQFVYDDLTPEKLGVLNSQQLGELWETIDGFRSWRYRNNALRRLLDRLPAAKREANKDLILKMATNHSNIVRENEWLREWAEDAEFARLQEPDKSLFAASRNARKRRCSTAKGDFLTAIKDAKDEETLAKAVETAKTIDGCYRRRGSAARRNFWANIEKEMEQSFGFRGWAEVRLRIGYLWWTIDKFEEAKRDFHRVLSQADSVKDKIIAGRAVFALARVAENEGELDEAVKFYKQYVTNYDSHENHDEAMKALILLLVDKKQWLEALPAIQRMVDEQTTLAMDDRSVGTLAFALYWAGRINYQLGNQGEAVEMWRRGASEFYSTFYGAISHYLHERVTGKQFALAPARTDQFRMHKLRSAFDPADRRRIRRIQVMSALGAYDEALCEISELDTKDEQPEKMALQALLLHAVGDWLEAIKTFDALPRSFRNGLPVGFERILYPRRYVAEIKDYAARAGVEPEMILSIIRQESVFNRKAFSPAGARGLMQLMPATARLESRRLSRDYLPAKERQSIKNLARRKANLFTPDLNLALGVHHFKTLMDKYQHPVFALCAYNASPSAANRWRKNIPSDDILAFVERIPYKETRGYVKLILRNYFYYTRWYEAGDSSLEHLDAIAGPMVAVKAKLEGAPLPNH